MSPRTEDDRQRARLAFEMYVYRLKQTIGSMAAALGGLDVLLFTDTVGLECPEVREAACAGMDWCGIALDPARDRRATGETIARVSPDGAPVEVLVVPNDEELVLGMEGLNLLN
jgi:acetate kinase